MDRLTNLLIARERAVALTLRPFVGPPPRLSRWVSLEERLASRIDKRGPDECWPWMAYLNVSGYPEVRVSGRLQKVSRVVYEMLVGPIPPGLEIDHLCRNRACCNPAHLEPVTHRENSLRSGNVGGVNARKTHCPHGHEYTPDNTVVRPSRPRRRLCRSCERSYREKTRLDQEWTD